jgi:hypothetical protein
MTANSNVHLIALGIGEHREGSAISEGGIARIAEGIGEAWFTPLRWSYGSGDNEMSGCVNLGDMFKGRRNPKGEADGKFLPAMYRAVAEAFGIDVMSSADKMAFQRGFSIAAARHVSEGIKFIDASVERGKRSVKVRAVEVPASVAFVLTDENDKPTDVAQEAIARIKSNLELEGKAIPSDADLLKRAGALRIKCIGGQHGVFGKVPSSTDIARTLREVAASHGLMPSPKARNSSPKAAQFLESLSFAVKCLDSLGSDEPEIALAGEGEKLLREVAERIAAYFAK